jgi:hypothetical protein
VKCYVATKFEEGARAAQVAKQLESAGHVITYKWWGCEQVSAEQALLDALGVCSAEALVLIAEKDLPYTGALVEMGMALGRNIPVYVIGTALDTRCIFMRLPHIHRGIQPLLAKLS